MAKREVLSVLVVSVIGFVAVQFLMGQSGTAVAAESYIRATLNGWNEVPPVMTDGKGEFRATINAAGTEITYELEYSGLSGPPSMAHIHFGQEFANGGVMVWICTAATPAPAGTPVCPASTSGKVTGKWTAASIVGPVAQGIPFPSPDMKKLLAVLSTKDAYVNVHTGMAPSGEIRGQIKPGKGSDNDDDDSPGNSQGKGDEKSGGKGKG
jgi:hypothetical protein